MMTDSKATRTVTVANREGLHARAATMVAELLRQIPAKVEIIKGNRRVDGTDVLQMLSLGAGVGEELQLEATGEDVDAALDSLEQLFAGKFGEEESPENP